MITSNLWANICNGAKSTVVYFIYKGESGPISRNLPEAVVVQFSELDDDYEPFISKITQIVAIPVVGS